MCKYRCEDSDIRIPPKAFLLKRTREILKKYNVRPRKRLSQNFVVDPKLIRDFIKYSELEPSKTVVEVGAGIGNLTIHIAKVARKVYAIEVDGRLVEILEKEVASVCPNVEVVIGDATKLNLDSFKADILISNTPYHISSKLLFKIALGSLEKSLMTFQREYAHRLLARPGSRDYGRLTVAASMFYEVSILGEYPPTSFFPRPEVYTSLVRLAKKRVHMPQNLLEETLKLARVLFSQRNRLVKTPLIKYLRAKKLSTSIEDYNISSDILSKRVYQLSPDEIVEIARRILQ